MPMKTEYSSSATPHLKRLSKYLTLSSFFISIFVLIGWMTETEFFKRLLPDAVAMNPLSAICFMLCAASLWIQRDGTAGPERLRRARWMALAVAVIGLVKLVAVVFGFDFVIDTLL